MMKDYILSIVIAAIICAVVCVLLTPKTSVGQITRLLSGVLLIVTVISPLVNISFRHITEYMDILSVNADGYVTDGQVFAQAQIDSIIKDKTEAYILDKANQLGLQIAVEVALDENNHSIPSSVILHGKFAPYTKEILSGYITNGLGIAKEQQIWISDR